MRNNYGLALALLLSAACAGSASAAPTSGEESSTDSSRARMGRSERNDERADGQKIIRQSADVYRELVKTPGKEIPQNVLSRAKCVAVMPNVVTAALVVGGSHGNGIASCRTGNGQWSPAAFVDITGGSLGAQVGGKSTDVVLFVMDQSGQDALRRGKFTLGADASVVAGNFGRSIDVPSRGVIAYQRNSGAFLGASLTGVSISKDDEQNRAIYGRDVDAAALLDGSEKSINADVSRPFTSLLPQQA